VQYYLKFKVNFKYYREKKGAMMSKVLDGRENPESFSSKAEKFKLSTKSIIISRLPRKGDDEFKSVSISMFNVNNPHKTVELPTKTLEFSNIEKVRIRRMNVSYYLEGNDLIVNNLEEIYIIHDGSLLLLKGYQGMDSFE
jgi:hypothetical protein